MLEMLNDFIAEVKCQYTLYLEAEQELEVVEREIGDDEEEVATARNACRKKVAVMRELATVAGILGFTHDEIASWTNGDFC